VTLRELCRDLWIQKISWMPLKAREVISLDILRSLLSLKTPSSAYFHLVSFSFSKGELAPLDCERGDQSD